MAILSGNGRVLVSVLNYNEADDTIEALRTLECQTFSAFDLDVTDNASDPEYVARIRAALPHVPIVINAQNRGYAGGVNSILQRGWEAGYDAVVVCNNDIAVPPDLLGRLVDVARARDDSGVVGAVEVDYFDGHVRAVGGGGLDWWLLRCRWENVVPPGAPVRAYDFVQGGLILFTRRALDAEIRLDEALFLYYEEVDVGLQLRRAGLRAYVDTGARFRHKAQKRYLESRAGYFMQRNRVYLARKYGGLHQLLWHVVYAGLIELPAKLMIRAAQGHPRYGIACMEGFRDGLLGRTGNRVPRETLWTSVRELVGRRLHPFRRMGRLSDYAATFATEGTTMLLGFAAFRLAALRWGPEGFGEYVLARRGISLAYLPLSCGMGLALVRYVAASSDVRNSWHYLRGAVSIAGTAAVLAVIVANLIPGALATLLFGSAHYVALVRALSVAVLGMIAHGLAYGFYRGQQRLVRANAIQLLNVGLVPLAAFMIPGIQLGGMLVVTGTMWMLTSIFSVAWGRRLVASPAGAWNRTEVIGELSRYGLPRVPGELALSGLFALPAIFVAHRSGVSEAGFVSFATSLLGIVGSAFAPLGVILLPSVSRGLVDGRRATLWPDARSITVACIAAGLVAFLTFELLASVIVSLGLGAGFEAAVPHIRVIALAVVPYVVFVVLRNVTDAASVRALNARNLAAGVSVLVVVAAFASHSIVVSAGLVVALTFVGVATWVQARGLLQPARGATPPEAARP